MHHIIWRWSWSGKPSGSAFYPQPYPNAPRRGAGFVERKNQGEAGGGNFVGNGEKGVAGKNSLDSWSAFYIIKFKYFI